MTAVIHPVPEEGQLVMVRNRWWVVSEVKIDALAGARANPVEKLNHVVSLASIEEDGLGEELEVIWELEPATDVDDRMGLPIPDGLDDPVKLEALLNASRWATASNSDSKHVQSPFRSGIEIEDFQLDPLARAITMSRANLLIADDVGLGKTIEAGLILLEFIVRHRAKRILIACPPGLQEKWQEEMQEKFGLDFVIINSAKMREIRRKRGLNVNPWEHHPRLITSIHYLKRDRPRRLFKETLPGPHQPIVPRAWDVLVLDEAQNCAPSGRGKYAMDSECTNTIREIAKHFQHRLFLSATPHNGYRESWTALLEMLDEQRFARGAEPDPKQLAMAMVRRLKSEIPDYPDGTPRFPKRKLHAIEVDYPESEYEVHALLAQYGKLRKEKASDKRGEVASAFVHKLLKKRLFSSPFAFLGTLQEHLKTLKGDRKKTSKVEFDLLQKRLVRAEEEEFDTERDWEEATSDAIETAGSVMDALSKDESEVLQQMTKWAEKSTDRPDAKASRLIQWLKETLCPNGQWNNRRVIIFTEYRDTQNWLVERLAVEGLVGQGRLEMLYGGMDPKKRKSIIDHFQKPPDRTDVRILLATECAGEGIDLQKHCDQMIHYEIPWNPNRLEQRNGRIDRRGQPSPVVDIHHFVAKGYQQASGSGEKSHELEADLEFLMRAAEKVETIRQDLGSVGPVIAQQVEEAMLGDRRTLKTEQAEEEAKKVAKRVPYDRDVAQRIEKMQALLAETRDTLNLDAKTLEQTVHIGLELAGKEPLTPVDPDGSIDVGSYELFWMPNFEGSWAECREGLRDPVYETIRPITFDHEAAQEIPDVVLVHLNHPLVQTCLRRLRAEIWRKDERRGMHRITARSVPGDQIEGLGYIVHSRMMVVGGARYRLHEEVIMAGGTRRDGNWKQFTQGEMESLLKSASQQLPDASSHEGLLAAFDDSTSLLETAVRARVKAREESVARQLKERAEQEAAEIAERMTELESSIREQLNASPQEQLLFKEMEPEEQAQLNRNRAALERRLKELPGEVQAEQAAFAKRFEDQDTRDFPISITILVPEGWRHGK